MHVGSGKGWDWEWEGVGLGVGRGGIGSGKGWDWEWWVSMCTNDVGCESVNRTRPSTAAGCLHYESRLRRPVAERS